MNAVPRSFSRILRLEGLSALRRSILIEFADASNSIDAALAFAMQESHV
jgi:hypothetical protein